MLPPRDVPAKTNQHQITVEWSSFDLAIKTGGASLLSYHLQWDKATDGAQWFDIQGLDPSSLLLTATQTNEVVGGQIYQFRVRASNVHGWGPYSEVVAIKAA
jgi:hypothetical protein